MMKSASAASLSKVPNMGRLGAHAVRGVWEGSLGRSCIYLVQNVRVWDFTFQLPGNANVGLRGIEAGARGPHDFNAQRLQDIDLLEGRKEM